MPYVNVENNVKIKYHTIGEGPPLLMLAGLGMDHKTWLPQIPYFKDDFKVIVFDNRGIGESSSSFGLYTIETMTDDAVAIIDHLDIKKTNIIGSSMGGMIAQEIAISHPEKVEKLILCSTTSKTNKNFKEKILDGLREIIDGGKGMIDVDPHHILFKKAFNYILELTFSNQFISDNKKLIKKMLEEYLSKGVYVETLLKQIHAISKFDSSKRLSNINLPTLIITGTNDKFIPPENSEKLFQTIPNSVLVKIIGGTHGMHYENADEFNENVMRFLKE